jgi:IclR family transcriptional regulator, KDG regulon repressor
MAGHGRNFSKSANRALDVLCHLASLGTPTRAAEIADTLGMARSSADQLLKTMVSGGYLLVSPHDKTYVPSPRLAPFGRWICDRYPAAAKHQDIVADVHRQTGDIVTLTVQNDCYMQIVNAVRGGEEDDPTLAIGRLVPVFGSAIGGAALTTKSQSEIRKLAVRARHQHAVVDRQENLAPFMREVGFYRLAGYSARPTRRALAGAFADYWSIAVPFPSAGNRASMVLGLSGPVAKVRARETHIAHLMRDCIQQHLGTGALN